MRFFDIFYGDHIISLAFSARAKNRGIASPSIVITGLDPVIHLSSQDAFYEGRWMAGSSPAMTSGA